MIKTFNKEIYNIYLSIYSLYVILILFSSNSSYAPYLQPIYKFTYISFIFVNLFFLFFLRDRLGNKSNYDYLIIVITILILFLRTFIHLRIIPVQLIPIYLFMANLRYVNINDFKKVDFKTKAFLLIGILILFICHLTPDVSLIYHRHGLLRIGAGFGNYNGFAEFVLCVIYSYIIFVGKKSYRISSIFLISFVSMVVFYLTDTRGFMVSTLILVLLLIIGNIREFHSFIEKLSLPFVVVISLLAILIPINVSFTSSFYYYYNKLFSSRLYLQHFATVFYPVKLTGYGADIMKWLKFYNYGHKVYIDNMYLILLMMGGIIGFLIFEYVLLRACHISLLNRNYLLCIIFISLSSFFVTEGSYQDISIYFPVIYAYILNYSRKQLRFGKKNVVTKFN